MAVSFTNKTKLIIFFFYRVLTMTCIIFSEEEIVSDIDCISTKNVVTLWSHIVDQRLLSNVVPLHCQCLQSINPLQVINQFLME